jgi:hypothetical protein
MSSDIKFDNLHYKIRHELAQSTKNVKIAVAWISFDIYEKIFKELLASGVKLDILCSDNKANRSYQVIIDDLNKLGANIVLLKMPTATNHMHHKFAIIDESIILNGSFNWSKNAVKSFENLMIVREDIELVKKFLNEFEKVSALNTKNIKLLQKLEQCTCGGKKINILVFANNPTKYNEAWGDVIQICSHCDFEEVLKYGIQDNSLHFMFDSYEILDYRDEEIEYDDIKYRLDRDIDKHLNHYKLDILIHAIGFVSTEIISPDGDSDQYTKILWKNKFVEEYILDRYETTFGVCYE